MKIDEFLGNQSVIISLDVDNFLFQRLEQVIEAGFTLIEINSTEQKLLSQIMNQYTSVKIGAGGIIDTEQLEQCYKAGVHFASSPGFLASLAHTANIYSMNFIPAVATISEAMEAMSYGYQQVRPFPSDLSFCTLLNKCLPKLNLFPAEIEWEEAEHFLNLPSVAAVGIHNPDKKQLGALSSGILV